MKRKANWKKAAIAVCLTAAAGLGWTKMVMAEGTEGPSTNVWIDVIKRPTQDRICVTVPMAYGFVVVGSQDFDNNTPISVEEGTLLLPNVRVEMDETSGEEGRREYSLTVTGARELPVRNYSTTILEENEEEGIRTGLAVTLGASMDARDETGIMPPKNRGYWTLTDTEPGTGTEDFKKYQMSLDGHALSILESEGDDPSEASYRMDGEISLKAPPDVEQNGWTAAGTANIPSEHWMNTDVKVGGVQGHYSQVEESLKVGTIRWTVEPDLEVEEEP